MSLLEALLLEPAPFDTWVAYRHDGVKGSGTLNDPWDGSTKYAPGPANITGLSKTGDNREATVTAPGHTFANGDVVTVSGVTGLGAARWNGTFPIYGVGVGSFKYYMTAIPDANPTNGDVILGSKVVSFPFDDLMNSFPANVRVHLGPSPTGQPFLTRGYADGVAGGYQPKPGMNIIGSGIDVTTLQLVPSSTANAHFFAVGHSLATGSVANPLDSIAVIGLTIDCNLTLPTGVAAACGGIRLMGNHARISRVKVINWGNKITGKPGFVLAVITADPATGASMIDEGIEGCIAGQPATSTTDEVLILHAGGKDHDAAALEGFGNGPFIRNCFVDGDATGQLGDGTDYRAKLRALSMGSCRGGIIEGNQIHNTWIGGPYLGQWSARDLVVRDCFYKNVVYGPYLNLQALGSSINVTSITRPTSAPSTTAEATTASTHPLIKGDRVNISGATQAPYNGVFVVSAVTPPDKFRYEMDSRPTADQGSGASMKKVLGVEKLAVEGNVIELAPFASGATPPLPSPIGVKLDANAGAIQATAYAYGDVLVRDNTIRYVDGDSDSTNLGYGIDVKGARNLIIRENLVEVVPNPSIENSACGVVKYFDNKTPAGVLTQGWNQDTGKKYDELATLVEDAFVLAFLQRR